MVFVDGRHQEDVLYTPNALMCKEIQKKYVRHGIVYVIQTMFSVFSKRNAQIIKLRLLVQI